MSQSDPLWDQICDAILEKVYGRQDDDYPQIIRLEGVADATDAIYAMTSGRKGESQNEA